MEGCTQDSSSDRPCHKLHGYGHYQCAVKVVSRQQASPTSLKM